MAYTFGDGFDCYASVNDVAGYWDSGTSFTLAAGRFAGSQCIQLNSAVGFPALTKSSGANDAVHHIICAFRQTMALSGTNPGTYLQLSDGATNQVCVVFRQDGTILLTSATPAGTTLATWTGGVTGQNVWIAYEFEVVIHPTAGSFTARRNGNTTNDFAATALNTRPGTNSYANKLTVGNNATSSWTQQYDDILWRSDPASVSWIGDVRCYTRMPASDVAVQWSKNQTVAQQVIGSAFTNPAIGAGTARYGAFTAAFDGVIGSAVLSLGAGYSGNLKCAIFGSSGSAATTVLGSATTITNPVAGANTFTFVTPVPVTKGTQYYIGADSDTTAGTWNTASASGNLGLTSTTPYASFPAASPGTTASNIPFFTLNITVGGNFTLVNETIQDGAGSYVYDANVGDSDLYSIAPLSGTPTSVIAVTTRAFCQKSDAGTRSACVQLKSGGTTVQSASTALGTSWGWLWRIDVTDPATGSAWTPASVNNVQIGQVVTA